MGKQVGSGDSCLRRTKGLRPDGRRAGSRWCSVDSEEGKRGKNRGDGNTKGTKKKRRIKFSALHGPKWENEGLPFMPGRVH